MQSLVTSVAGDPPWAAPTRLTAPGVRLSLRNSPADNRKRSNETTVELPNARDGVDLAGFGRTDLETEGRRARRVPALRRV